MKSSQDRYRISPVSGSIILVTILAAMAVIVLPAGATLYSAADCSCGALGLPLDGAYPDDTPENGYYSISCQYGGYAQIPYKGGGRGVEFTIHKKKPEIAHLEFKGRLDMMPATRPQQFTVLELNRNDPVRAVYSAKRGGAE